MCSPSHLFTLLSTSAWSVIRLVITMERTKEAQYGFWPKYLEVQPNAHALERATARPDRAVARGVAAISRGSARRAGRRQPAQRPSPAPFDRLMPRSLRASATS